MEASLNKYLVHAEQERSRKGGNEMSSFLLAFFFLPPSIEMDLVAAET